MTEIRPCRSVLSRAGSNPCLPDETHFVVGLAEAVAVIQAIAVLQP